MARKNHSLLTIHNSPFPYLPSSVIIPKNQNKRITHGYKKIRIIQFTLGKLMNSSAAGCQPVQGYVLVMLFMKYVSDKKDPLIDIPPNASFYDMVKHKGKSDIGDQINKIIGEFAKANGLTGVITVADFNDDEKLGKGKDKVDKLTNLITIFEKKELDFSATGQRR
jgi:hypothetical protein